MIQFNVQDISEYRGQLMGIATLLVIFGHSVGNGVAMPRWMESLCGLSSVGVDIFLLVSGLGLWYSLTSLNGNNVQQGVRCWYLRRYKRKISYFWMSILPLALVAIMKVMQCGYWPEFLVLPFVAVCCPTFKYMGKIFFSVLNFLGKISLESYLLNVVIGTWIIWYLPNLYNSSMNKGCYLSYFIVCVVGTVLAYLIHLMCNKLFFKSKER